MGTSCCPSALRRQAPPRSAPRAWTISRRVRRAISATSSTEPAAWLTASRVSVSRRRRWVCSHRRALRRAMAAEVARASTSATSSRWNARGSRVATLRTPTSRSSSSSGTPRNETSASWRTRSGFATRPSVRRSSTTSELRRATIQPSSPSPAATWIRGGGGPWVCPAWARRANSPGGPSCSQIRTTASTPNRRRTSSASRCWTSPRSSVLARSRPASTRLSASAARWTTCWLSRLSSSTCVTSR